MLRVPRGARGFQGGCRLDDTGGVMTPDCLDVVCSLGVAQNAARLDALRFGFERLMEVACSWVATTPRTGHKIELGKVIWHAAMAADQLAARLDELQGLTQTPRSSGPLYTAFTN